jgi:LacI family transcriptional regulator
MDLQCAAVGIACGMPVVLFYATGCASSQLRRSRKPARPVPKRTMMDDLTNRPEAPTISQVAEAAGVSRATVSHAFTRPDMLRADTVRRVVAIAEKIGYVPNHTARALSTGRYGNVALVVPDVANPFFPPLIRAAQVEAEKLDFCMFLGNSDENPAQEEKLVSRFSTQVEGFILASSRLSDELIRFQAARRPLVLINRDIKGIPRVLMDSGSGVAEAVDHLASLGHKRIAYISGPKNSWSNAQRRAAVRRRAKVHNLKVLTVPAQMASFQTGYFAAPGILDYGATAAVAFDDLMAQGALAGLAARGVEVPTDFSIVGCDDVLGAMTYPPLSSVSNACTEAGRVAVSLLMEMLKTRVVSDVRYVLGTSLVIRKTTGRAANPR